MQGMHHVYTMLKSMQERQEQARNIEATLMPTGAKAGPD
jgi:hypothetical protein